MENTPKQYEKKDLLLEQIITKMNLDTEDLFFRGDKIVRKFLKIGKAKENNSSPKLEITKINVLSENLGLSLKKTREYFLTRKIKNFNEIFTKNYGFNSEIMASFSFFSCICVVLKSPEIPKYRGVAHIRYPLSEEPIINLIKIFEAFGAKDIKAFIIKSKNTDPSYVLETIKKTKIKINYIYSTPSEKNKTLQKDVIIIPKESKIIITDEKDEIIEIAF